MRKLTFVKKNKYITIKFFDSRADINTTSNEYSIDLISEDYLTIQFKYCKWFFSKEYRYCQYLILDIYLLYILDCDLL